MTRTHEGSSPRLRALFDTIRAYVPGKPAASTDGPGWKLSSNENPYPPLPGVLEAATAAAGRMNRYPDLRGTELTNRLAEHLAVPASHLALGTGSSGLLQQLLHISTDPGDEVVHAWRSFESYPIVTRLFGARPVEVPLTGDEAHDLDAMARAVTDRTRLVIVCTPNNPTGRALRRDVLEPFLDRLPTDVLIVLDEAYVEFNTDPHGADGREALLEQGWTVPETQANFVWLRLGARTDAFAEHCRRAGVSVRPYGQDGVRITIGERRANDAALVAAGRFR